MKPLSVLPLLALLLTGCSGLSTFKGSVDTFSCGLPDSVHCTSLTQNYERENAALDASEKAKVATDSNAPLIVRDVPAPVAPQTPTGTTTEPAAQPPYGSLAEEWWARYEKKAARERANPSPLHDDPRTTARTGEAIAYLLLLPRVDAEGDLHLQKEVWIRLDEPLWEVERLREDFLSTLTGEV